MTKTNNEIWRKTKCKCGHTYYLHGEDGCFAKSCSHIDRKCIIDHTEFMRNYVLPNIRQAGKEEGAKEDRKRSEGR